MSTNDRQPPGSDDRATGTYASMALLDLLDAFASNEPVPGGGCAAALAGAVGTSLLIMVAGISRTKTGAPEEAADLAEASARLRPLRDTLTSLIQQDSDAYAAVVEAMNLPKETDEQKRSRRSAIDAAMQQATDTPLDTMRCCQQALRGAVTVAASGNRNAASDTGAAVELLMAGLRSARMNVDINIRSLSDAAFVDRVRLERDALDAEASADAARAMELLA
jgi:formiminotetrahydrofolate cyclodeaminase